jgi:hypothetical protein
VDESGCEHFYFYSVSAVHQEDGSLSVRLNRHEFDFAGASIPRVDIGDTFQHMPPWASPEQSTFWDDWALSPNGTTYAFGLYPDATAGEIFTVDMMTGDFTLGSAERGWLGFLDDETLLAGTGPIGVELVALRKPFTESERTEVTAGFSYASFVETLPELGFAVVRGGNTGTVAIPLSRLVETLDEAAPALDPTTDPDVQDLDISYEFQAMGSDYLLTGEVPGSVDWNISDLSVQEGVLTLENTRPFIQSDLTRHVLYYGQDRAILMFQAGAIYGRIEESPPD